MFGDIDFKVIFALVAAAVGLIYVYYKSKQKKYKLPPGPTPLPVVGNLLAVGRQDYMYIHFTELAKKYGDVFQIYMGSRRVVILNSTEAIHDAFVKKGVDFANRPDTFSAEVFGTQSIALGQFSPEWKIQRKIAHSALRKFATGEVFEKLLQECFEDICKDIEREKGEPFDPYPKMTLLIYNVIMTMVFGKRFEHNDPYFIKLTGKIDKLNEDFGNGFLADVFPIFKYFPSRAAKQALDTLDDVMALMKDTWDEHQAAFNPDELSDFVDLVISAKKEAEKEDGIEAVGRLTEEHYLQLLADMFFAGTDTSRFTLSWVIGLCASHPEVQAKMQAEIDDAIGRHQLMCINHRQHLPYTEAVLHEAWRLYPVVPLDLPHATTCDTQLHGYDIPKDTWVLGNIWALHHDPKEWDETEKFKPERHLDENGTLAPKPNCFLPFSTGRRVCVGESVAKVELHLLTAMLFQRYTFTPPPGEKLNMEKMPGIFTFPKSYKIVANPRE